MISFNEMVIEILKQHPEIRMTAREIGALVYENYPEFVERRRVNTIKPHLSTKNGMVDDLGGNVYTNAEAFIKKSLGKIKVVTEKPRKWYYSEETDEQEVIQAETIHTSTESYLNSKDFSEKDLYPLLSSYLEESNLTGGKFYVKRIDEKKSENKAGSGGNKWLFPDVVAVEILSTHWHDEVKEFAKYGSGVKTRLWSFEVKKLINRSNVRETYFQAVCNSGWANFGYLVARDLTGEDTLRELRMLAELHGIGFILLDAEQPQESEILIPASERFNMNWEMINRLTSENKDFRDFIKEIRKYYQTGDIKATDWGINTDF